MNKYRTELLERLDKKANCKVGKQCGDICIPKQSECQLNAPDIPKVSPELVKGVASGAGILGISTASYLAFRAKYRAGFAESAQMAEKMSNDVKVDDIPPEQTRITFATGGFYGPMGAEGKKKAEDYFSYKLKTNILDADHHVITHRNDEFNGVENPAMIKVAELAKEGKKPDALLSAQMGVQMFTDHYRQTLETALVKGRNPESVKLAAEVIAYNKKYPDKKIYLTGHSAGGMINHEAAEILDKLKIKVNVVNFGSGYFGLTEKVGNSATIADRGDLYLKTMAGVRDPIYVGEDKITEEDKHSVRPYMNSPEVVKVAKSLFNQKQNTKKDSLNIYQIARADAIKKAVCKTGKQCGDVCIPKKNKCKPDFVENRKKNEYKTSEFNTQLPLGGLVALAAVPIAGGLINVSTFANAAKQGEKGIPSYMGEHLNGNISFVGADYLEKKGFDLNEERNRNHAKSDSSFWRNEQGEELFMKKSDNKYRTVSEAIAASVGKSVGIPVNDVTIGFNENDPSKLPSTIHGVVPGKTIHQLSKESSEFKDIASALKNGLNPSTLQSVITKHPDFAKIIALDLYIRNTDIHGGNMLFDQQSNKAYTIDKGLAFSDPEVTNNFVNEFIKIAKNGELDLSSPEKKENLKVFVSTLKELSNSYPPGDLSTIEFNTRAKMKFYGSSFNQNEFQKELKIAADKADGLIREKKSPGQVTLALQSRENSSGTERKAASDYTVSAYREKQSFDHIQRLIKYYEEKLS